MGVVAALMLIWSAFAVMLGVMRADRFLRVIGFIIVLAMLGPFLLAVLRQSLLWILLTVLSGIGMLFAIALLIRALGRVSGIVRR